ncbi:class I SAM-dependent methyltransferase [Natronobeatus ordinarius]|uniref:class I SAM-dependent methyltransferase n=1 Tax=Natronobeatus ordinarius TaxID=2963433 RepID=UPI0020CC208C|nr:class I SAM-dependent methyltransferase [Natronobeatus ordinarius]
MKDAIRRNFDVSVGSYEAFESETGQFAELAERLATVVDDATGDLESLLDAGAGTGASTRRLEGLAEAVVALDISWPMLRENPAGRRVQADFDHLPFGNGSFDAVVFTASLFLTPDPDRAASEAARVLRAGGVVAAVAPQGWTTADGRDAFADLSRDSRSPSAAAEVESALAGRFTLETGAWTDEVSAERLRRFHSIPAVAARLYPTLPPDERVQEARALLADVEGPLEQRWRWLIGRQA